MTPPPLDGVGCLGDHGCVANELYRDHPDHPLHDVPQDVLDAARACLQEAAQWGGVHPDDVQPLADAVVMACLPPMRAWLSSDRR